MRGPDKRADALRYGQQLLERASGDFTRGDWAELRETMRVSGVELAALASICRWFGTWETFKRACAESAGPRRPAKCSEAELKQDLLTAAELLGKRILSTHTYEAVRAAHPEANLRSNSTIRKHLGAWPSACALVGLEAPEQCGAHRFTAQECIDGLRRAKIDTDGRLTMRTYGRFVASLEGDDVLPHPGQVIDTFGSWEAALRFADIDQSDAVHPTALWNAQEAREIAQYAEIMLRRKYNRPFDEESYGFLCGMIERPMPTWKILSWLLAQ